jgi:hypothetical protein
VNSHLFETPSDVIDYIIFLDTSDDEYLKMMNQPWFVDNVIPDNNKIENIKKFLYKIFNN